MNEYDVVIVGAGTTGCVLAARLSENPNRSVLLVEAGPHYGPIESHPVELQRVGTMAANMPGHPNNWSFVGQLNSTLRYPVPRGKAVGGSAALNGTNYVRATPQDFDGWAAKGNDEWSFDRVLPFWVEIENDLDFHDDFHGSDGPTRVWRYQEASWTPQAQALAEASHRAGFPEEPDKNSPYTAGGFGPVPTTALQLAGRSLRQSTAITFLEPALQRPNLHLQPETTVHRVLFDGSRAVGIQGTSRDGLVRFHGGEIVLCAGAVKSPHLLMLSGIGPGEDLRRLGISLVHHSPGVGKNLQDHCGVSAKYSVDVAEASGVPAVQASLTLTADGSNSPRDMLLFAGSYSMNRVMGGTSRGLARQLRRPGATLKGLRGASIGRLREDISSRSMLSLNTVLSKELGRGELKITSPHPGDHPELHFNYLSEPEDVRRLRDGIRLAVALLRDPAFRKIKAERTSPTDDVLESNTELDRYLRANLLSAFHSTSTCQMGAASDPSSVVDQHGRVHGVQGLRVIDISILPDVPRAGTFASAILLGARAADFF